jgi:hypothetical protein
LAELKNALDTTSAESLRRFSWLSRGFMKILFLEGQDLGMSSPGIKMNVNWSEINWRDPSPAHLLNISEAATPAYFATFCEKVTKIKKDRTDMHHLFGVTKLDRHKGYPFINAASKWVV